MDERLLKSLVKALGINTDELAENAKKFIVEIQQRHKIIEETLIRIEAKLDGHTLRLNSLQQNKGE
jgi:phosphopantetheine adenylyltransferase